MSAFVAELEQEVGEARQRLVDSLERLRSPAVFNDLKDQVWDEAFKSKDELVRKVADVTKNAADRALQDIKARAAANPAAALSIGAGIALHLVRRPPISAVLIGLGLWSLFRTPPTGAPDGVPAQFGAQMASAANSGAEAARRWGAIAGQVIQDKAAAARPAIQEKAALAGKVIRDRAAVAGQVIQDKAEALKGAAAVAVEERLSTVRKDAGERSRAASKALASVAQRSLSAASRLAADEASRDPILLGAAAAAVLAAIGLAIARRQSRPL